MANRRQSKRAKRRMGVKRYPSLVGLSLAIAASLAVLETAFRAGSVGVSIFDSSGPGQVALLAVPLLLIALFIRYVAAGNPLEFLGLYWQDQRRARQGFLFFLLATTLVVVGFYCVFALLGIVSVSSEAVQALNHTVLLRTVVALLVVLVLATSEELIFRAFIFRHLMFDASPGAVASAMVVASLIFALLHNLTDPLAWFTAEQFPLFVGLFILGFLLCVTYYSTGSITCAIAVHAAFLGSKVFLRRTELLDVNQQMLMLENSADMRMSPVVWGLWIAMALVIFLARHWLRERFAVETRLDMMRVTGRWRPGLDSQLAG
jgi:membrane protease YdiL (CAAX protease family)